MSDDAERPPSWATTMAAMPVTSTTTIHLMRASVPIRHWATASTARSATVPAAAGTGTSPGSRMHAAATAVKLRPYTRAVRCSRRSRSRFMRSSGSPLGVRRRLWRALGVLRS